MIKEIKTIQEIIESLSPNERAIIPYLKEETLDRMDEKIEGSFVSLIGGFSRNVYSE